MNLLVEQQSIAGWTVPAVVFAPEDSRFTTAIHAPIGNSITTSDVGKRRTAAWKLAIAGAVKAQRGSQPLNPAWHYAITLGFSFNPGAHGNRQLDVENFMKPTLDALAAGLFCDNAQDATAIVRFDYDDSNFRYLFVNRLPDAPTIQDEGVAIVASVRTVA